MPFEVRLLSPEEQDLRSRISMDDVVLDTLILPELENKKLQQWLTTINSKLEMLLSNRGGQFGQMNFKFLNISASGMRFHSKEKFEPGDLLEIKLVLQINPHRVLYLISAVTRVERMAFKVHSYTVAVRFLDVTEEIRHELLNYDFERQKQLVSRQKAD